MSCACASATGAIIIVGPEDPADDGVVLYGAGWVVQHLGVSAATLRRWHLRHGLGPAGYTDGGHRRYSVGDLTRLQSMRGLIADGLPIGEAARLSHLPGTTVGSLPAEHSAAAARRVEMLTRAAAELDQPATSSIIVGALHAYGVVPAWTDVLAPALRRRGEQFARTADGVNVEHLLSECTRGALWTVMWRPRRRLRLRPVLIAAPDGEQHVLPMFALAAALAEAGRPSILLGASVPRRALTESVAQLDPVAVFLWSQAPGTAIGPEPTPLDRRRDVRRPVVVLGGPGWPKRTAGRVDSLAAAVRACIAPTLPSLNRPGVGRAGMAS